MEKAKEAAIKYINENKLCYYRYGLWSDAFLSITKEQALQKLKEEIGWDFGMGFYELKWEDKEGEEVLLFNELKDSDLY